MRGYFYKNLYFRTDILSSKYYLNFSPKAKYYLFNKNGIPIVKYNKKLIVFPITIFNYFLGLVDSNSFKKSHFQTLKKYINNQYSNGKFLIKHEFDELNFGNKSIWYSNLPHSILFSLMVRINLSDVFIGEYAQKLKFFYDSIFQKEIFNKKSTIFIEYPSIKNQPLNGQIFGLFAVYDAVQMGLEKDKLFFEKIINSTLKLTKKCTTLYGWSKYNSDRISSPFYHFLHISQLRVCEKLDKRFRVYRIKYQIAIIFLPFVLIIKVLQKIKKK